MNRQAIIAAFAIAIFPVFAFWSATARPYCIAGFFVLLGWRWWPFYILALLSTPFSILGVNLFRLKRRKYWIIYTALGVAAIVLFQVRPDSGRGFFDAGFLFHAKRLWYIPLLSVVMHGASLLRELRYSLAFIAIASLIFFIAGDYKGYFNASDWSGQQCDYATNKVTHDAYNSRRAGWLRMNKQPDVSRMVDALQSGRSVSVGIDYYGLTGLSSPLIPEKLLSEIRGEIGSGKVVKYMVSLENRSLIWVRDEP